MTTRRKLVKAKLRRWTRTLPALWREARRAKRREAKLRGARQSAIEHRAHLLEGIDRQRSALRYAHRNHDHGAYAALEPRLLTLIQRRNRDSARIAWLEMQIAVELAAVRTVRLRLRRGLTKRRFWRERARFSIVRLCHWRELHRMRQTGEAEERPWMANGYPQGLLDSRAGAWLARAVVLHRLTCVEARPRRLSVVGSQDAMLAAQPAEAATLNTGTVLSLRGPDWTTWLDPAQGTVKVAESYPLEERADMQITLAF